MFVQGVSVDLDSVAEVDDVAMALRTVTADGPFVVSSVDRSGDRHRCVFHLKRPDLVVGYRSVIELQRLIDRDFDIVSVAHHSTHFSNKDLVLS